MKMRKHAGHSRRAIVFALVALAITHMIQPSSALAQRGTGQLILQLAAVGDAQPQIPMLGPFGIEISRMVDGLEERFHSQSVRQLDTVSIAAPQGVYKVYAQDQETGIIVADDNHGEGYTLVAGQSITVPLLEKLDFSRRFGDSMASLRDLMTLAGDTAREWEHIPDEIVVKFHPDVSLATIHRLMRESRTTVRKRYARMGVYRMQVLAGQTVEGAAAFYTRQGPIEYAEPNAILRLALEPTEWSTSIPQRYWALHEDSHDRDIDAPEAWDVQVGTPSVVVAVIDTGIDLNHPDLQNRIWVNDDPPGDADGDGDPDDDQNGYVDDTHGWYFNNLGLESGDVADYMGHGTHVAGIVGAQANNGERHAGVCWNCRIMAVKIDLAPDRIFGATEGAAAIRYAADNGAAVINMSWGGGIDSTTIRNALEYAHSQRKVLVAATGNDGDPQLIYPARYGQVMAVGNLMRFNSDIDGDGTVDHVLSINAGSNYENKVNLIVAPGTFIYSTMPTYHVSMNDEDYEQDYDYATGTSMAAPFASGVAALVLSEAQQRGISLDSNSVYWILEFSADYIPDPDWDGQDDTILGTDPPRNVYVGYGKVNAYSAASALFPPSVNIIDLLMVAPSAGL